MESLEVQLDHSLQLGAAVEQRSRKSSTTSNLRMIQFEVYGGEATGEGDYCIIR